MKVTINFNVQVHQVIVEHFVESFVVYQFEITIQDSHIKYYPLDKKEQKQRYKNDLFELYEEYALIQPEKTELSLTQLYVTRGIHYHTNKITKSM